MSGSLSSLTGESSLQGDEAKRSSENSFCKERPEKDMGVVEVETDFEDVVQQQHPSCPGKSFLFSASSNVAIFLTI